METPKKRRISDKKVDDTLSLLTDKDKSSRRDKELKEFMAQLRDDPDLFDVCRAAAGHHSQKKSSATESLKRGTRTLGDVPLKYVRAALANMSPDIDEAAFSNISSDECRKLLYFALRGTASLVLPRRCMTLEEFIDWCCSRHELMGHPMRSVSLTELYIDWEWTVGACSLVAPQGLEALADDQMITSVRNNCTNDVRELANAIRVGDVGATWFMRENFSIDTAYLENTRTGAQQTLGKLFDAAELDLAHNMHASHFYYCSRHTSLVYCCSRQPAIAINAYCS